MITAPVQLVWVVTPVWMVMMVQVLIRELAVSVAMVELQILVTILLPVVVGSSPPAVLLSRLAVVRP